MELNQNQIDKIARDLGEGFTSGRFTADGIICAWKIKAEVWRDGAPEAHDPRTCENSVPCHDCELIFRKGLGGDVVHESDIIRNEGGDEVEQ